MGEKSENEESLVPNGKDSKMITVKTFEDILELLGGMRYFQVMVYVLGNLIEMTCGLAVTFFVFEGANPGWTCPGNTYTVPTLNSTSQSNGVNHTTGRCYTNRSYCDDLQFNTELTSIVTEWGLICNREYIKQLMISLLSLGLMVGVVTCGRLADLFGRKKVIMIGWVFLIALQSLLRFATSPAIYGFMKVLLGFCAGSLLANSSVWQVEFMPLKFRALIGIVWGWPVGGMLISLIAYYIRDWQTLGMTTGLIMIPLVSLTGWFVPESPRWLLTRGNVEGACSVFQYIARVNRRPVVRNELMNHLQSVKKELDSKKGGTEYSYRDLFRPTKMAIRTLVVMFQWLSVSFTSYGIMASMTQLTGSIYLNVTIGSAGVLLVRWTVFFVANKVGRRWCVLIYLGVPGLCLISIMIMELAGFLDQRDNRIYVTYFALAAQIIIAGAWSSAAYFAMELYPTAIRTAAFGTCSMAARIGAIVSPFIVLLNSYFKASSYIIFGTVCLSSAVLSYVVLPETSDKPLTERTVKIEPTHHYAKTSQYESELQNIQT